MPTSSSSRRCPCGSREPFDACCGALHRDLAAGGGGAPTAEWLMRSRYSAFAVGDADYLLATWHPSTRPPALDLDDAVDWLRLEIEGTSAGGEGDERGTVAFAAHFWDVSVRERGVLEEDSLFLRHAGRWHYVGPVA